MQAWEWLMMLSFLINLYRDSNSGTGDCSSLIQTFIIIITIIIMQGLTSHVGHPIAINLDWVGFFFSPSSHSFWESEEKEEEEGGDPLGSFLIIAKRMGILKEKKNSCRSSVVVTAIMGIPQERRAGDVIRLLMTERRLFPRLSQPFSCCPRAGRPHPMSASTY